MAKAFDVETKFEGMEMIHCINDNVEVVTDLSTLVSILFKNGKEVRRTDCSGMTLGVYGKYLRNITENA